MNNRIVVEHEIRDLGIRLPNGTKRKEYGASFMLPIEKIANIRLEGAEQLGLDFTVDERGLCTLKGVPNEAGDYTLRLCYDVIDGEAGSMMEIPVAFNPDPRSLWRNIPTSRNVPYYKCDEEVDYVEVGDQELPQKDMVAASLRGRSHAQEGRPRDDHFRLDYCQDSGWYILAVADGAGSAAYSRKGSEIACDTVVEYCHNMLTENPEFEAAIHDYQTDKEDADKRSHLTKLVYEIVFRAATKAHEEINTTAKSNEGFRPKDFATTLMFAICKRYDFGWFIASFWVGDGAICLYDREAGTAKLLGTPDEGEFSGQTRFLTMPEVLRDPDVVKKRMRMAVVDDFTALFLMTDGVSDPMFETEKNLNSLAKWDEFYDRLLNGFPDDDIKGVKLTDNNPAAAQELLDWLNFWSPGNHDDRTIAILY